MKSFRQFLSESASKTPQGVLVCGDQIFVGVEHGNPVKIQDKDIVKLITSNGNKHGYYYEGTGEETDIKQPIFGLSSKDDYEDGWDEDRTRTIQNKIKPHHMSILFSNVDANWGSLKKKGLQGSGSVFDGIQRAASIIFDKSSISRQTVEDFLTASSKGTDTDFLSLAKNTSAAGDGSKTILKKIEKIAWPTDWETKKRTTGPEKLVDMESDERNSHVLDNMGPGVYMMGSGHLPQISKILKDRGEDFTLHGGSGIL